MPRIRPGVAACAVLVVWLAGCGYPGDPLPPALNRPNAINDLAVVERGARLIVHFTVPDKTTEGLPVKGSPGLELRIGPLPEGPWNFSEWARNSEQIADADIRIEGALATAEIPAPKFYNKTVVLGVKAHGPRGRDVGWSRFENFSVVPALPVPEGLEAKDAPDAIRLDWHAAAPEFRIFRKLPDEKEWALVGTSRKPFYADGTIEFGRTYQYFVQSVERTGDKYAESELSQPVTWKPTDHFAPATPIGLMAVPGTRTIELVWERNTEKDLASYRIYRDGQKISDGQSAPAFSDKDVKPGVKYRYQVSSVDTAGNESALAAPVEALIP